MQIAPQAKEPGQFPLIFLGIPAIHPDANTLGRLDKFPSFIRKIKKGYRVFRLI